MVLSSNFQPILRKTCGGKNNWRQRDDEGDLFLTNNAPPVMAAMRLAGNILARFRFHITVRKYSKKDVNSGLRAVTETLDFVDDVTGQTRMPVAYRLQIWFPFRTRIIFENG
jgi:hypothetical protein